MAESLVNERNGLAWQRTALSWLGAGAVVARYVSEGGVMHARTLLGMLMSAVGVIIWAGGAERYRRKDRRIRADEQTPLPTGVIPLVWLVTLAVIAALAAVEFGGVSP